MHFIWETKRKQERKLIKPQCAERGWFRLLYERQSEGEREAGDCEMAGTTVSGARLSEERLRLHCDTEALLRTEGYASYPESSTVSTERRAATPPSSLLKKKLVNCVMQVSVFFLCNIEET